MIRIVHAKPSDVKIERARLQFEKVVRLYRARPTHELYDLVQRAHDALKAAQRDAVVERWRPLPPTCPRCETPLDRTSPAQGARYGCPTCDFGLQLVRTG